MSDPKTTEEVMRGGWIGVDLDGTLARYDGWKNGVIGDPIPLMVERVKKWLASGADVRIVTARVNSDGRPHRDVDWEVEIIQEWCTVHIGRSLPITCSKDFRMIALWDDRVHQVEQNTGVAIEDALAAKDAELAPERARSQMYADLLGRIASVWWEGDDALLERSWHDLPERVTALRDTQHALDESQRELADLRRLGEVALQDASAEAVSLRAENARLSAEVERLRSTIETVKEYSQLGRSYYRLPENILDDLRAALAPAGQAPEVKP